ncbi:MAG: hypothetical protein HXY21_07555 [Parvularculaceae bacterium]|nr:hypothetical protein [Parvularculaceae bacterium]
MKKLVVAIAWIVVLGVWVGIFGYKAAADPSIKEWTVAVTAGALTLEAAFWITAAALGISLLQSRKAVFRFLASPFRRNQ